MGVVAVNLAVPDADLVGYYQRNGRGHGVGKHHNRTPQIVRSFAKCGRAKIVHFFCNVGSISQQVSHTSYALLR
jgi:hypothetical protein